MIWTVSAPPTLSDRGGGGGHIKMSAWEVLQSPCHRHFPVGLTMILVKNKTSKNEMILRAPFSNVNLGLSVKQ